MIAKKPVNIWAVQIDEYVRKNALLEVSSPLMFEPSSKLFHPDGMFSERIFGQLGTPERIGRLAYIDLNCHILAPLTYLNLISISSWYKDIMESKVYALWDEDASDFVAVSKDTTGARTGYEFFIKHVKNVTMVKNKSRSRNNKIGACQRAFATNAHLWSKFFVCPAGWRDVKTDVMGRVEVDEVNKLYTSLLITSKEIKSAVTTPSLMQFFDPVKYHLQLKAVEIFTYWKTFYEGKTGYGQGTYSKRRNALGTRNVITAPAFLAESPKDPQYHRHNDTHVSLFQSAKAFEPVVVHTLNNLFTAPIYTMGSIQIPAIDPKDFTTKYVEVSPADVTYALDAKSKHDFINQFNDSSIRHDPVQITGVDKKIYYLWMVYDLGKDIYIFRNVKDLQDQLNLVDNNRTPTDDESSEVSRTAIKIDVDKVRPLTKIEMLYIATHVAVHDKGGTVTRFPAIELGSIYPTNVVVMSTAPSRVVTLKSQFNESGDIVLPNYPIFQNHNYVDSMVPHASKTVGTGADFDGDKMSFHGVMSKEGLAQIKENTTNKLSIISPSGKFLDPIGTQSTKFAIHALTYHPLDNEDFPKIER